MFDAGIVTFVPKGDWVNNVTYYPLNIVNYNGLSWIARRENIGQTPADGQYWMTFGSAVPIATTSTAGIVIPDGITITVDQYGHISAVFSADLDDLDNVNISTPTNGQVLKYNATSQKWENGTDTGGLIPHLIIISETGSTVTVTKGAWSTTATETSTGHFECDVPEFGTYTIDAVLAGDDAQVSLVVDTVKIYTVDDSHFHADITVTYPTGATVSCSKSGETTMYATGSPYTFTVHSSGTWTITGVLNGVTITENVTISTSGQTESVAFIHTLSVDLYSAASDTVSFTDETGSKTATTDSTGKAEGVSITYSRFKNNAIQFTSSVAKNPSDLSSDYTKLIYLDENTTEVKVMPEDSLYWYGYESSDLEDISSANGWSGTTYTTPTHLTNYIDCKANNSICGVASHSAIASANKIVGIVEGVTISGTSYGGMQAHANKVTSSELAYVVFDANIKKKYEIDTSTYSNFYMTSYSNRSGAIDRESKVHALWYKQATDYNFFSAANDIVTYKDSNNNDVVFAITDEDGYAIVDYSAIPSGTYTLYSSVAKDPENLSNPYSKTVTIGANTTEIVLMPEARSKMLYWYGFKGENCEEMSTANGWTGTYFVPTYNANYVYLPQASGANGYCGLGSKTAVSGTVKAIYEGLTKRGNNYGFISGDSAKAVVNIQTLVTSATLQLVSLASQTNQYISMSAYGQVNDSNGKQSGNLYALWYE